MKKVMLVGKISAGKTTLCQRLNNEALCYQKTQTVQIVGDNMIDTPGEYLERRNYYRALIVTSVEAEIILLVQDATDENSMFAPQFSTMFSSKPVIGVVTKSDIATQKQVETAKEFLNQAGAQKLFIVSSTSGNGCEELYLYLSE